jgi:hypothetical protein
MSDAVTSADDEGQQSRYGIAGGHGRSAATTSG